MDGMIVFMWPEEAMLNTNMKIFPFPVLTFARAFSKICRKRFKLLPDHCDLTKNLL